METTIKNPLFKVHKLTPNGMAQAQTLGRVFEDFYNQVHETIFKGQGGAQPGWEGREWAIVRTKLEEAAFYAKKSLASQPGASEDDTAKTA